MNLARQPKLYIKTCNLKEIVGSAIYLLNYKARKQDIQLVMDLPDESIWIKADENQLQQILINLILNSMEAIQDKGTVTIKVEMETSVNRTDKPGDNYVAQLSVIDTGHGIDAATKEKIFNPFFTTREGGTGLGLSIVKRIADQNKWKIAVASQPGKGTTISITFPLEVIDAK